MREAGKSSAAGRHMPTTDRDEALFRSLQKKKRARRRRVVRTVVIVVLLLGLGLTGAVYYLRRRVQKGLVSDSDVSSAKAKRGSVSTTVSGSGTLENVDEEEIKIPGGVVIDEVLVKANVKVKAGDVMNIMQDAMSSITSMLSILLGGIAGISLVVGGIGIMNIMLVTVTERTREIGIRKAIGATHGAILRQFLTEAVVLCMLGCAIGIFLSWTILRIAAVIASGLSMSFTLNGPVVAVAVGFCILIGVVFGLYPANKAAKMKPIDALHYGG